MRWPRVRLTVGRLMVVVALGGGALGVLVRWVQPKRDQARCLANLRAIGVALAAYESDHGTFPPAYTVDASGRPTHSWRALLLPYLDEPELARAYRFDEPWDGPRNSRFAARVPAVFQCPAHAAPGCSSYAVPVGPATAFPGSVGLGWGAIQDSGSVLVVELAPGIPWLAPRDLRVDPFLSTDNGSNDERLAKARLVDLRRRGLAPTAIHPLGANFLFSPDHAHQWPETDTNDFALRFMMRLAIADDQAWVTWFDRRAY